MDDTEDQAIREVHARPAKSGRVSYGDTVVIHESSKTRVTLTPFFVPRTEGTDLAVKITSYKKAPPPDEWAVIEDKSISLNEVAARRLAKALNQHLAVSEQGADGDYIVIRAEGTAEYGNLDPEIVTKALAQVLSRKEIAQHLANTELSDELVYAFRGAIRLREMQAAVSSLRQHLDTNEAEERVFQEWCEQHSWAFGNAYVLTDDVREISPGDHLDLLLPSVISGYRDIVELKTPEARVLLYDKSHRNYYFSSETAKAIGQVHRYLDVLQEVARDGLRDHPEIMAYHPRAIVVIGRSHDWGSEQIQALHGLNARLNGITVMTYDQLLAQGERLVESLSTAQGELFDDPIPDFPTLEPDEDDFPF